MRCASPRLGRRSCGASWRLPRIRLPTSAAWPPSVRRSVPIDEPRAAGRQAGRPGDGASRRAPAASRRAPTPVLRTHRCARAQRLAWQGRRRISRRHQMAVGCVAARGHSGRARQRRRGRALEPEGPHAHGAASPPRHRWRIAWCGCRRRGRGHPVHRCGSRRRGPGDAPGCGERPASERGRLRLVSAPVRYVSGEETAAVHFVNEGIALPTSIPPRPFERGVDGRPTLVQNVETLAHVALIARFGDEWFRSLGHGTATGTTLVTVGGAVPQTVLIEIPQGLALADAINAAGGLTSESDAVLLGGYYGGWVESSAAWGYALDAEPLRRMGYSLGCGVIAVLPSTRCGVIETARIVSYLAHESARQCGPCTFGLRAISAATGRIAGLAATAGDLEHVQRWAGLLAGRGACRHPDGAAGLLASALRVFAGEFMLHADERRCSVARIAAAAS